ncbi:MAG: hypothetical protein V1711_02205, partial [bacterium]
MRIRNVALFFIIALAMVLPSASFAATIWRSAETHPDEVQIYTPEFVKDWYGGTAASQEIKIGTWNQPDFTTTASTTAYIWARWNGDISPILDVSLRAYPDGTFPIPGGITTTTPIITQPYGFYAFNANATSTLREYTIPVDEGSTIHNGEDLWAWFLPSYNGYGAIHWLGSSGTLPYLEICEGECDDEPPPPDPCDTPEACASNVLFLPGIEGSRLYEGNGCGKGGEEKLWE